LEEQVNERKSDTRFLLHDLDVVEVSLVKKPANGRSFYLQKNADKGTSTMVDEKILAVLETPAANEDKWNESIQKEELSEDAVRAVRAALRLLDAFRDEIPSGTLNGLADAAGMDRFEEETNPEKDYEDKAEKADDPVEALKGADIPEEVRPALEQLWKSSEESAARVSELESILKAERDTRLHQEEVQRVTKEFSHVPGTDADNIASMLINLRKSAPDSASNVEELLRATERAMVAKDNGAFEEAGVTTAVVTSDSAWGKIEAIAKSMVQKGEVDNHAKAVDHVLTKNPDLYAAYLAEK
jgi:hypothetical protein